MPRASLRLLCFLTVPPVESGDGLLVVQLVPAERGRPDMAALSVHVAYRDLIINRAAFAVGANGHLGRAALEEIRASVSGDGREGEEERESNRRLHLRSRLSIISNPAQAAEFDRAILAPLPRGVFRWSRAGSTPHGPVAAVDGEVLPVLVDRRCEPGRAHGEVASVPAEIELVVGRDPLPASLSRRSRWERGTPSIETGLWRGAQGGDDCCPNATAILRPVM